MRGHIHATYNQDGDFLTYLIVVNRRGCRDTSYEIPIEVGVPIDHSFNMVKYYLYRRYAACF
ncbi:MAG: hypothetical protein R2769_07600 [Saprospiraceae bacterium]